MGLSLSFTKKDIKYHALVFVFIILLKWTWGYVDFLNSDAFEFSQTYITSSPQIISELGEIKSTRLEFINFQRKYAGGIWTAKFNVAVEGANKSGTVYMSLKNAGNGWIVEDQKLDIGN